MKDKYGTPKLDKGYSAPSSEPDEKVEEKKVEEVKGPHTSYEDERKPQKPKELKKEVKEPVEDRSAYNCPDCKGDGLQGDVRCSKCQGTGKV